MKDSEFSLRIFVVHGPNLNLLGEREPEIYGEMTLAELNQQLRRHAKLHKSRVRIALRFFQSNGEGAIIEALHAQRKWAHAVVINPGAYTHYSYAIRDAIAAIATSAYEVHLSDLRRREKFRRISVIKDVCLKQFQGSGWKSYAAAIDHAVEQHLRGREGRPKARAKSGAEARTKGRGERG